MGSVDAPQKNGILLKQWKRSEVIYVLRVINLLERSDFYDVFLKKIRFFCFLSVFFLKNRFVSVKYHWRETSIKFFRDAKLGKGVRGELILAWRVYKFFRDAKLGKGVREESVFCVVDLLTSRKRAWKSVYNSRWRRVPIRCKKKRKKQ